ncbi:major facilitator superfamily domain-containing protein [Penicillium longicatenatum]|uniref:major facilitator superfamily domain-containing protein n=1 Tax=Penicillium longicatenatum TaxID=1561947 RepID=UPI002546BF77|nr:major facilitator superfamily domain-containing protein [Penicillium longicatenatum]KAJ5642921.1 major facilitator superfamily domain-containing protein [Penicillium longicatenatum]
MATAVQTQTQMIPLEIVDSNDEWNTPVSRVSIHGPLSNHAHELSRLTQETQPLELSRARAVILVITLTGLTFVGIPSTPLVECEIDEKPSLANGCCLLLAGSLADFFGNRVINLVGCCLLTVFILACSLAESGLQLILFRTFQGIATSMCLPTAFSIMTDSMPAGKRRNIGFSCLGLGQPFGFSVGLVLGGIFQDSTLGWRFGYYLCAGATSILTVVNYFKLPQDKPRDPFSIHRLRTEIDWVGILLSSACLGIISYVFANITDNPSTIRNPENISLLCVAAAMIPSFWAWMQWRERSGRPALIPNSLWNNTAFATICVMVLFSWGVLNGMETILSLFLQEVQQLSAIQAALRFLPNVIIGIIVNIGTGLVVHRLRANYLIIFTSILSAVSPLLMAIIDPKWSWWYCVFWVMVLGPLSADVIFTVANLIIADSFSPKTQGLAGAVFNTIAQFGTSIGLTTFAIIAASVTDASSYKNKSSPEALMVGYRAVFWTCFGLLLAAVGISAWGLRQVGKVGLKRE